MMQAQDFPFISHSPKRWAEYLKGKTPILESIVPLNSQGRRNWRALGDDTLVAHARWKASDEGIDGKGRLSETDTGLYQALWQRHILQEVGLDEKKRDWASMGDSELVALAKEFVRETGISGRTMLQDEDPGLCKILRKRQLMSRVFPVLLRKQERKWKEMSNQELVEYARAFIRDEHISGRKELTGSDGDPGLYQALRKRGLLDDAGLPDAHKNYLSWTSMENKEVVSYAKNRMREMGIRSRKGLEKADPKLYRVLWKRGLLGRVFSKVESSAHAEAVDGVLGALESFGDAE